MVAGTPLRALRGVQRTTGWVLGVPKAGVEMAGTVTTLKGLAEDGQGGTFRLILPAHVMGGAGMHSGPEQAAGRQTVARTPSPQHWGRQSIYSDGWGGIWTFVLTQPETYPSLCLPEMGACSLSFYLELIAGCPKLCPDPSVLLDPMCPSGDCPYTTKDVLGVRTLKMIAESF